tara:strand:- start:2986 stop:3156 length:171 start_codon:yes stop_codon:yes gene_type:complete
MTLNEANTRKQLIDRALESVGWKDEYLNCEYTFTDGNEFDVTEHITIKREVEPEEV